ncbi:MAG: EAL domain-containing protein [Coleofasciculaceae cyanobacterium]
MLMQPGKSRLEFSLLSFNQETPQNLKLIASLQTFSLIAGWIVILVSCSVLLGWYFDIPILKSVLPGALTMKANTAVGFIFAGLCLCLCPRYPNKSRSGAAPPLNRSKYDLLPINLNYRSLAQGFAIVAILVGLLTLLQYVLNLDFGIDQLLFAESPEAVDAAAQGRMAPNTALNFVLIGVAEWLLAKKFYTSAQSFSLLTFLIAFLGLLGHLYGITSFYGVGSLTGMALHTSISFIFIAVGVLFARPDQGLMTVISGDLAGGRMARRLALAVISVPPFLGWLVMAGKQLHLYDDELGIVILCILYIVILGVLIWWNAKTLGEVDYRGLHDLLTGLPNRIFFYQRLSESLAEVRSSKSTLAVLFLDLDRFKKINDTLDHQVGDELLKAVALRLKGCLQAHEMLARWGGDEFAVFLPEVGDREEGANIAQSFLDVLKPPFGLKNHNLHISSSIGISFYPSDGENSKTLMKNADFALCNAKKQGRNNYQFYNQTSNERFSDLLVMENKLHHALERDEMVIHYQPKVNITTEEVIGMEALLRWQAPGLGLVPPGKFIPLAEDNGLIVPIGEWVLRTACIQNQAWIAAGLLPTTIAVNLSVRQFRQPNLVEIVRDILAETGLQPHLLELEITESIAMDNVDFTKKILHRLENLGVRISMDDFGTGYSSLAYLKNFPLHTLKIDRSFVRDLSFDSCDVAIAAAVVALGKGLNLSVVAEGVETNAQLRQLESIGCYEMQGYFFSRPVPYDQAKTLISSGIKDKIKQTAKQ